MNRDEILARLKKELTTKEGRKNKVYLDTEGKPTVGIGHLVLTTDKLKVGDVISEDRIDSLFATDIKPVIESALNQAKILDKENIDMVCALAHVCFQLGIYWNTKKFVNTWKLLAVHGTKPAVAKAIRNIRKSLWYKQTPVRAKDFIAVLISQYDIKENIND